MLPPPFLRRSFWVIEARCGRALRCFFAFTPHFLARQATMPARRAAAPIARFSRFAILVMAPRHLRRGAAVPPTAYRRRFRRPDQAIMHRPAANNTSRDS